jgi:hypothetical protein
MQSLVLAPARRLDAASRMCGCSHDLASTTKRREIGRIRVARRTVARSETLSRVAQARRTML